MSKQYYIIDRHRICLEKMIFIPEKTNKETVSGIVHCKKCNINYPAEYDLKYFKKLKPAL